MSTYRHESVSFPQLSTEVSWSSGEDEGDEDPLSVLPANDVEAQSRRSSVQHHLPGLPVGPHSRQQPSVTLTSRDGTRRPEMVKTAKDNAERAPRLTETETPSVLTAGQNVMMRDD